MSPEESRRLLAERLVWKETTGSTNDDARQLAVDGAEPGTVVVAERQTAGRGRKGAEWFCAPGEGLAFSVILEPEWPREQWAWTALGAGLAVCEALERLGFAPAIKWPNDVLLDGCKVCGILVESPGERVVVGVGLNVNGGTFPEGEDPFWNTLNSFELQYKYANGVVTDYVMDVPYLRVEGSVGPVACFGLSHVTPRCHRDVHPNMPDIPRFRTRYPD